jgi:DNA-binding beta-propeller fold protein YncE
MAVDGHTGHIFIAAGATPGQSRGTVTMLDEHTLAVVRTVTVGALPTALLLDARRNRIFVVNGMSQNPSRNAATGLWNTVSVLDTRTGAGLRTVPLRGWTDAVIVDPRTGHLWTATSSFVKKDQRLLEHVKELDATTGALLHRVPVSNHAQDLALDQQARRLIVGDSWNNTLTVIDADTGTLVHTTVLHDSPVDIVADDRTGQVFVSGTNDAFGSRSRQGPRGEIYVVDARTGRLMRTVPLYQSHLPPVTTNVPLALDGRAGHLWALDEANETLSVLDTGTGHLLRTIALRVYGLHPQFYGLHPQFMIVDGVTHHGFALSVGPTGATLVAVLRI